MDDLTASIAQLLTQDKNIPNINDDTDLVEYFGIDSLKLVSLLSHISTIAGKKIDLKGFSIEHIRTIRSIRKKYFQEAPYAQATPSL